MSDNVWHARCLKAHALLDELKGRTEDRAIKRLAYEIQTVLLSYEAEVFKDEHPSEHNCPSCDAGHDMIEMCGASQDGSVEFRCTRCRRTFEVRS